MGLLHAVLPGDSKRHHNHRLGRVWPSLARAMCLHCVEGVSAARLGWPSDACHKLRLAPRLRHWTLVAIFLAIMLCLVWSCCLLGWMQAQMVSDTAFSTGSLRHLYLPSPRTFWQQLKMCSKEPLPWHSRLQVYWLDPSSASWMGEPLHLLI